MRFGKKGSADILGALPGGRFLAVECKAKGGRLSPEQQGFLADVQGLGGLALAVDNGSIELKEGIFLHSTKGMQALGATGEAGNPICSDGEFYIGRYFYECWGGEAQVMGILENGGDDLNLNLPVSYKTPDSP